MTEGDITQEEFANEVDLDHGLPQHMAENVVIKWTNRRRMSWLSLIFFFFFMIISTILIVVAPLDTMKVQALSYVIYSVTFVCVMIVGAYMGTTAWSAVQFRRS